MRKVIVFQHVAHEILGTLNPLLKERRFRIRYINFERHPDMEPDVKRYNGLIVLGGYMGVYEADKYKHVRYEMRAIEEALKMGVPIMGICLGAQLIAHVLGATVRKHMESEMGWSTVELTERGSNDPLLGHFKKSETVFQMHGDTFDIPKGAIHLAQSGVCEGQAFRFGERVYGLQFHLEVDKPMIQRWMKVPRNLADLAASGRYSVEQIGEQTERNIQHSIELSKKTFSKFIDLFGIEEGPELVGSGHGKSRRG